MYGIIFIYGYNVIIQFFFFFVLFIYLFIHNFLILLRCGSSKCLLRLFLNLHIHKTLFMLHECMFFIYLFIITTIIIIIINDY